MLFKFKKIVSVFLFLGLFLFCSSDSQAQEEFNTSYETTYQITDDIETIITHKVKLINNLANIYATSYSFSIGSTRISNVKAWNNNGNLELKLNKKPSQTEIKLYFDEKIVGKDKSFEFSLSYKSFDFASLHGQVLDIGIPQIKTVEKISSHNTRLLVPLKFGQPSFISPKANKLSIVNNNNEFSFNKKQILQESIVASFGDKQIFNFDINYFLANDRNYPIETEIALIPDTNHQSVIYDKIEPLAKNIEKDDDGNWIATYQLKKNENIKVNIKGKVLNSYLAKNKAHFNQVLDGHLKEQSFWPTSASKINQINKNLKTAKETYDYVVKNINYDYDRVSKSPERKGALWVLDNPDQAVCMEFSDLFITLARANKIPAREVNGYAHTDNPALRPLSLDQDVLHAWPQYYDESAGLWIDVDPTWENTTGGIDYFNNHDLNRITFVTHGVKSDYPIAAGAYKTVDSPDKNISIVFSKTFAAKESLTMNLTNPGAVWSGIPYTLHLEIKNTGNTALYEKIIDVKGDGLKTINPNKIELDFLAPFSKKTVDITIQNQNLLKNENKTIIFQSDLDSYEKSLEFKPAILVLLKNTRLMMLAGGIGIISILIIWWLFK